jgi:oligopeptide/dipeptide ABC transporter ATP-binding protein
VPQDPSTALDPLYRVGSQVQEVLERLPKKMRSEATATLFDRLGVVPGRQRMREYPHQFSGGMQQRVAIAIALAKGPALLIADEPTTALDVTTQLSILRLLDELRRQEGLTTLLITHNLAVARLVCQQIAVMYGGIIVEAGPTDSLLRAPRHPYTRALIAASLEEAPPRTPLRTVAGQAPRLDEMPSGCPFAPRCAHVIDECRAAIPPVTTIDGIQVRCIRAGSI